MSERSIGRMRHRLTLMGEQYSQGAGGRLALTTPIIAEVWASVDDSARSREENASQQHSKATLSAQFQYAKHLMSAQRVSFLGNSYRITGLAKRGILNPIITLEARSVGTEKGTV